MFAKFNYLPNHYYYNIYFNSHLETGRQIYNDMEKRSRECLHEFILQNGHIDGSALKEHWFNIVKADVFLSHSHKDIEKVKGFAGWLYDALGLTSFIDSCVWGYCDDLLLEIDKLYCWQPSSKTYNYTLRNYTTTHVHTMLASALTEMIDNTECMIFFNTPSSIILKDELQTIKSGEDAKTLSPWIYHELSVSSMIQSTPPKRLALLQESRSKTLFHSSFSSIDIEYNVEKFLRKMIKLEDSDIMDWAENHKSSRNALDELYVMMNTQK